MILGKSLSVMSSRFSLVYKTLLFIFVVLLIVLAIGFSILNPIISPISKGMKDIPVWEDFKSVIIEAAKGNSETQQQSYNKLVADFEAIYELVSENMRAVSWSIFVVILFVFIAIFAVSLSHYTVSDILYHFMSSNSRFGYLSNLFANVKYSLKYSLMNVAVSFIYALFSLGMMILGWLALYKLSILLAITGVVMLGILLSSIKSSFLHRWLPSIVVEKKPVLRAFSDTFSFSAKKFGTLLSLYFMAHLLLFCFTLFVGLFTFGFGFILAIAISLCYKRSLELVLYHHFDGIKYYTEVIDFDKMHE